MYSVLNYYPYLLHIVQDFRNEVSGAFLRLRKISNCAFELGTNKEFVKNLLPEGLEQATNLSDISEDTDIVITMLPNGDIVEEVYDNIIDKFTPGTLFVDCSTIEVDKARELHKKCKDKKILSLDAPVSGGVGGAEQATLTFMVGGTENAYKNATHFF